MSAGMRLVAALLAELDGHPALAPMRVFDFVPARFAHPYAVIGQPVLLAEDAVDVVARIGSVEVQCRDGGEDPARLRALLGALEDAMAALPDDLGGGWRLTFLRLARSEMRMVKEGWLARSLWGVRMFRVN